MNNVTRSDSVLKFAKWLWLLLIPLAIGLFEAIAPTDSKNFTNSVIGNVLTWLFQPGLHLTIVIIVLALLIVVPAVAWVMRGVELRTLANKPLRRYLRSIYEK